MKIDLISKIKKLLTKHWKVVRYSDDEMAYNPELRFFLKANYEMFARHIWLYFAKKLTKQNFIKKISRYLNKLAKLYSSEENYPPSESEQVADLIYELKTETDDQYFKKEYIQNVNIEFVQKYRTHCCDELNSTDNAGRRYFFRSPIVYVRKINTYVLTNLREYIYYPSTNEYHLDQTIHYEILDYCPFCGCNLKKIRIESDDADELIKDAIRKWRDNAIGFDGNKEEEHRITFYGVNIYESFRFISDILSEKYANFDNRFGVSQTGVIKEGGNLLNVEKLFNLYDEHKMHSYVCDKPDETENAKNITSYFRKKFKNRSAFSEDEIFDLKCLINNILCAMYHNPEYFDELLSLGA